MDAARAGDQEPGPRPSAVQEGKPQQPRPQPVGNRDNPIVYFAHREAA